MKAHTPNPIAASAVAAPSGLSPPKTSPAISYKFFPNGTASFPHRHHVLVNRSKKKLNIYRPLPVQPRQVSADPGSQSAADKSDVAATNFVGEAVGGDRKKNGEAIKDGVVDLGGPVGLDTEIASNADTPQSSFTSDPGGRAAEGASSPLTEIQSCISEASSSDSESQAAPVVAKTSASPRTLITTSKREARLARMAKRKAFLEASGTRTLTVEAQQIYHQFQLGEDIDQAVSQSIANRERGLRRRTKVSQYVNEAEEGEEDDGEDAEQEGSDNQDQDDEGENGDGSGAYESDEDEEENEPVYSSRSSRRRARQNEGDSDYAPTAKARRKSTGSVATNRPALGRARITCSTTLSASTSSHLTTPAPVSSPYSTPATPPAAAAALSTSRSSRSVTPASVARKPGRKGGTQAGPKPHQCSVCGGRFGREEHLKRHMNIHTGEKLHLCGWCGKKFSRKDNCKQHEKVHWKAHEAEMSKLAADLGHGTGTGDADTADQAGAGAGAGAVDDRAHDQQAQMSDLHQQLVNQGKL